MHDDLSERGLIPLSDHLQLPAVPLTRADIPGGSTLAIGMLFYFRGTRNRPMLTVLVTCPRCRKSHSHPWRWDWGLSPDVASYQIARCRKSWKGDRSPYWVGLSPEKAAENARIHAAAHRAYEAWVEKMMRIRAEREALKAERRNAKAPDVDRAIKQSTPFWLPPVGSPGPKAPS